jgi:hypothetical protein
MYEYTKFNGPRFTGASFVATPEFAILEPLKLVI